MKKKARELMVVDSYEHYHATNVQRTVPPDAALNDEGLALFEQAKQDAAAGRFKDAFDEYYLVSVPTGCWTVDLYSPRAAQGFRGDPKVVTLLTTRHDLAIYGHMRSIADPDIKSQTSACIFVTDHWALTASGSLYALGMNKGRI